MAVNNVTAAHEKKFKNLTINTHIPFTSEETIKTYKIIN